MKAALVIGNGPGWQQETVCAYSPGMRVFAVNRAVSLSPVPVDYAVSKHPHHLAEQIKASKWEPKAYTYPDYVFPTRWDNMTSGMCAIGLAIDMEFDVVHVAGLPLSDPTYDRRVLMLNLDKVADPLRVHVKAPFYYWWARNTSASVKTLSTPHQGGVRV
ncbi:hypothetical protein SYK_06700 [Pseudodesulfovibrio nedwellii]|uniref:Uncharacterized protein n=1 Tax=Pseudodesulfovibrio nedwellii TaxID=2973072 RepID=A0ABN6S3N4_9BACT|nr:hypothetical protein [Pseudodesulfovibrio nedwellii]BDQ36310.1 hypothetical protein SYK_06700 [Pseudodesulfovibrio nedwellii]